VPNGVYAWLIEYEFVRNGTAERFVKSGDISILR
jgi:hypothetical protein